MLSLLPASMDPPLPHLPRVTLPITSSASTVPTSPSQSGDPAGTRKRKFQPISQQTAAAALAAAAAASGTLPSLLATPADNSWAGDVLPLPTTALLLSAAVRSSTASTASTTPSPRPHSTSSLPLSSFQRGYLHDASVAMSAGPGSQTPQSHQRPASQPPPATLAPIVPTPLSPAAFVPTYSSSSTVTSPASYAPTHLLTVSQPTQPLVSPVPTPLPPPSVPASTITTLMPVMPYSRIEPSVDQHFAVVDGDTLLGRYRVVRLLGRGTFSQVVQCRDLQAEGQGQMEEDASRVAASGKRSTDVAIKIVRAVERYRVAAEREARLLQSIEHTRRTLSAAANVPYATDGCVSLLGSFMLGGHLCLVFPVLGLSLYDFLRLNRFRPLFPAHIRHIGYQLLQTCAFLHDECGIIHADIKVGDRHHNHMRVPPPVLLPASSSLCVSCRLLSCCVL